MGKIFLSSDWHLVKYDKETDLVYMIPEVEEIITNERNIVGNDDIFIFMGDMFDAEVNYDDVGISDEIRDMTGLKIFIRGNNDTVSDEAIKYDLKFDYIYKGIIIPGRNVLISHTSIPMSYDAKIDDWVNIHGHIHRDGWDCDRIPYYHPAYSNINICNRGKHVFEIDSVDKTETERNLLYIDKTEKPFAAYLQNHVRSVFNRWLDLGDDSRIEPILNGVEEMWGII